MVIYGHTLTIEEDFLIMGSHILEKTCDMVGGMGDQHFFSQISVIKNNYSGTSLFWTPRDKLKCPD